MWYLNKVTVKQNPNFYYQDDVIWTKQNKVDKNEYEFNGLCGCWFESIEKKEPRIGENRWICDTEFRAWKVIPKRKNLFFKRYQIWWVPVQGQNTTDEIRAFYKDHLLKVSI